MVGGGGGGGGGRKHPPPLHGPEDSTEILRVGVFARGRVEAEGEHLDLTPGHVTPTGASGPDGVETGEFEFEVAQRGIPAVVVFVHVDWPGESRIGQQFRDTPQLELRGAVISVDDGQVGCFTDSTGDAEIPQSGRGDRKPEGSVFCGEAGLGEPDEGGEVITNVVAVVKARVAHLVGDLDDHVAQILVDQEVGGLRNGITNGGGRLQHLVLPLVEIGQGQNHAALVECAGQSDEAPAPGWLERPVRTERAHVKSLGGSRLIGILRAADFRDGCAITGVAALQRHCDVIDPMFTPKVQGAND
ncbi:MAG TPA: hypothetical protein DCY80_00655 [Solibacterales bacterium]|nr:hypothetical protein [Bryobacterales bacterium]